MSDTTGASRQTPPRACFTIATGVTAGALTPTGLSAGQFTGWITGQAVGGDINVRFGDSTVGAAGSTDWVIPDATSVSYYVGENTNYVSVAGTGSFRWHVSN